MALPRRCSLDRSTAVLRAMTCSVPRARLSSCRILGARSIGGEWVNGWIKVLQDLSRQGSELEVLKGPVSDYSDIPKSVPAGDSGKIPEQGGSLPRQVIWVQGPLASLELLSLCPALSAKGQVGH